MSSDDDVVKDRELFARSLDLYERIDLWRHDPSLLASDVADVDDVGKRRLAEWERLFDVTVTGDPTAFDRRLRYEGLDRNTVLPLLSSTPKLASGPLPEWIEIVRAVRLEMSIETSRESLQAFAEEPIPFVEYWAPWVVVAIRRVGASWSTLKSQHVKDGFLQALLWDLATTGARTLMYEFDLFRALGSGNDLFFAQLNTRKQQTAAAPIRTRETSRYRAFLGSLHGERARSFLDSYPCLARLAATRIEMWSRHVDEILTRLHKDRAAIETMLGGGKGPLGDLESVRADLSDPHGGGRRVARLDFTNGTSVGYKPRSLAIEGAWKTLIERVNDDLGFTPRLRTVNVLARPGDDYGWVEWIDSKRCESDLELADYYRRCGALVALVTLLRGSDCHFENIIANGDQPVLIDHEVLLAPDLAEIGSEADIHDRILSSALKTGLLPQWSVEIDGTVVDLSGIGARRTSRVKQRINITNLNSDDMGVEMTADVPSIDVSSPGARSAGDFEAEVIAGFESLAKLIASLSPEARVELTTPFAEHVESRHILRGTVGYGGLLGESRQPELMTDGLRRSIALDRIARMMLSSDSDDSESDDDRQPPRAWPIVRAEHEMIAQGDVPSFFLKSDQHGLFIHEKRTGALIEIAKGVFTQSGIEAVRNTLRRWDENEIAIERRLIVASFSGKAAGVVSASALTKMGESSRPEEQGEDFDDERAVAKALAIARAIAASAIVFRGEHHRVGLDRDEASGTHQVMLLGPSLYSGTTGIAMFLGSAARMANDDDALRAAAHNTLRPLRAALRQDPRLLISMLGLGGFDGLGGILYAFTHLSVLLEDPTLIDDDVKLLLGALQRSDIERPGATQDMFSGTAGLILALSALHRHASPPRRASSSGEILAWCADHLLRTARKETSDGAMCGWPLHPQGRSLCGLAHGNAGIAMALIEAWRWSSSSSATQRPELLDVANRALAYERSLRDDKAKNWPDLRDDYDPNAPLMSTWCNGAPGIALARSRILDVVGGDNGGAAREDLAIAIESAKLASRALPAGHLCCGTAGVDEILFEVGVRNDDAALIEIARRRTMARLVQAEKDNGEWPHVVTQALMRGSAGIGLGLLRMSRTGRSLPCVLDLS